MNPAPIHIHHGMTFGFLARNGYFGSPEARLQVDRMADIGVRWVVVIPSVIQETFASTRQYRDFELTPADDELRDIIDYLHHKGIKVQLRPMVTGQDGAISLTVGFPDDGECFPGRVRNCWRDWFASMRWRTLHYARLAQRSGCEAYGLDSELDQTLKQDAHWKEIVAAARSVYQGHLTVGFNRWLEFEKLLDANHDFWLRHLDSLGISFYTPASDGPGASAEAMAERLRPTVARWARLSEQLGKPIYFSEAGCCSMAGAAREPWSYNHGTPYDGEEQANYLRAILSIYKDQPWWMGLYWWKWDEQNDRPQYRDRSAGDKSFSLAGKPAAKVFAQWSQASGAEEAGSEAASP